MGHKNYSAFSEKKEKKENKEVIETPTTEEVSFEVSTEEPIHEVEDEVNQVVEETTVETVNEVNGFVDGCDKLYVRKEPNTDSEPIATIDRSTSLVICLENSTEDFYKVKTSEGVEGFCMKKFININ